MIENESLKTFFQDLKTRGLIANSANLENFYQLNTQEKVIYLGIDCTGERLHIGHLFLYLQAVRFANEGFKVLLLLGGGTSKIGDPSDKSKERPLLEEKQIEIYCHRIKEQLEKILIKSKKIEKVDFSPLEQFFLIDSQLREKKDEIYQILEINSKGFEEKQKEWEEFLNYIWPLKKTTNFQIVNNKDWLEKINSIDFLRQVGKNLTVAYLSSKETIKKRIETGISFLEFSYPLFQAYDFFYLHKKYNCHGQLGGSDQWGNMTVGLELIRKFHTNSEKEAKVFAFNFPLLTEKKGKKISKSNSGDSVLWLDSEKKTFYDFWSNLSDEQAKTYIRQFTFLKEEQIKKLEELNNPPKLRILQRILLELVWFFNYGEIKDLK